MCIRDSLWNSFENRKRPFSGRKINHQSYGPETGDFFRLSSSGRPPTRSGAPFSINIRGRNWRLDLGFHTSWEATSLEICRKQHSCQGRVYLPRASNRACTACCAPLPTPARLKHHHEPLGRGCCDCLDYESSCDVAQPHFLPRRGRGGSWPSGR